mgnify:CR=1 FL=1
MKLISFKKSAPKAVLLFALSALPFSAWSEVSIIVHPSADVTASGADIAKLYLGKSKSLAGTKVIPINLESGNAARDEFNGTVLKKSDSQLKSYWSRLVFTGKAQPPKDVGSEADAIELVKNNPNMIGYVSSGAVVDGVKVIASF